MMIARLLANGVVGWFYLAAGYARMHLLQVPRLGARGHDVRIFPTAFLRSPRNIRIGDNTYVGHNCCLWASPKATITVGSDVVFGPNVVVLTANHGIALGMPIRLQAETERAVVIGDDAWIGANSVVLPGVTIGDGCVVAAGSVVTKDMPANWVVAGTPAKPLRARQ